MNTVVELAGKSYALRFTVNALCCLEEKMGQGFSALLKTQLSSLRGLLWCGLLETEKGITLHRAGDLLQRHLAQGGDLKSVSAALAQALEQAGFFPKPERAK